MSATICVQESVARPALPDVGIEGVNALAVRMWNGVRRAVAVRQLHRSLERMPDWALRDIGIDRDDIDRVVDENLDADGRSRGAYPF